MDDYWQNGYDSSMFYVSSQNRLNEIFNQSATSFHPYTNVPFTIDKNILTFQFKPLFNDFVIDTIYINCCLVDVPLILELSINDQTISFKQQKNIVTVSKAASLHQTVKMIFGFSPSIKNICVTVLQIRDSVADFKLSKPLFFIKGQKYEFGPFTEESFDRKYIPKNFCLRKIIMKESIPLKIINHQGYLFHFQKEDAHSTKYKRYQIKLKCDYPIFHSTQSETKISCATEFTLRGVMNPNYNAESFLNEKTTHFVTETTRVMNYDTKDCKLDNRDFMGELFLKYMTIQANSPFVGGVGMKYSYQSIKAIWDDAENYTSKGWITSVTGMSNKMRTNELTIPFCSNPTTMLPQSYLFLNRCEYFQILCNPVSPQSKITLKLCCMQVVASYCGQLCQVFSC